MISPSSEIADAFQVAVENGEIVLEFGAVEQRGGSEVVVNVTDRIRIPMQAARRLSHTLGEALKPHLHELRRQEAMGLSPADAADAVGSAPRGPARPSADRSGTQAATLLRLVGDWGRRISTSARSRSPTAACAPTASC